MAITKTWYINQMEAYPEKDGLTNVVFTIHWTLMADDGNNHRASTYGSVGVELNPNSTYTPFEEITESQAIEWVKNSLGEDKVAELEAQLNTDIDALINPLVVTPPLPWMRTPVAAPAPEPTSPEPTPSESTEELALEIAASSIEVLPEPEVSEEPEEEPAEESAEEPTGEPNID